MATGIPTLQEYESLRLKNLKLSSFLPLQRLSQL